MAGRSRKFGRARAGHSMGGTDGHDELMITPLLDLFVALIPFLILGTVMSTIHIVDVGISKPVPSLTKPKNNFDLNIKITSARADLFMSGKTVLSVDTKDPAEWMKQMRAKLIEIKKKNLDELKIRVEPAGNVQLETVMSFMDEVRDFRPEDGEILKKEGGKSVRLKYLFPQVILKGVYGT